MVNHPSYCPALFRPNVPGNTPLPSRVVYRRTRGDGCAGKPPRVRQDPAPGRGYLRRSVPHRERCPSHPGTMRQWEAKGRPVGNREFVAYTDRIPVAIRR
jgi:hypothetical protein